MALPQVYVDVGFTGPRTGTSLTLGDSVRGLINTGTVGSDDEWITITPWVRSWSLRRGANRGDGPGLRYEAGTCTVELNNGDRRFDPTNLAGPYVSAGETQVQPMVRVRIRAVWNNVTYFLFYGYADGWALNYQFNAWSTVTLTATDATKIFASYDRAPSLPAGAGETTGARIERILDVIDWPDEDRIIDTGDETVIATDLSGNALTEMQLVQDTEVGDLYMDAHGRLVFRSRSAKLTEPESVTAQAIYGDGGLSNGELPYADVKIDTDDTGMANLITVSRDGGTAQVVEDTASREKYLTKTYQRLDLLFETDSRALAHANYLLGMLSRPEVRFSTLTLITPSPQAEDQLWPEMLGREFGDRISVIRRPPGGGTIGRDVYVRGVEHSSDGVSWQTTFTLQSATRDSYLVIGDAELGVIGSNAIAY